MARQVLIDLDDVVRGALDATPTDPATERILDAAADLFATRGLRRCSVEEIAERSGVGRTTVYRRFEHRDQIVEAVLARECHRFFTSILRATEGTERIEDRVVDGLLTGLEMARTSLLGELVRTQPELLALFTVDAAPLIRAATDFLVMAFGPVPDDHARRRVGAVAELLVRLSISWVLSGAGRLPLDDDAESRRALHDLLDPLLVPLGELRGR